MSDPQPTEPFFLIVIDHDRGFFTVEGPMTGHGTPPPVMHVNNNSGTSRVARPARIVTRSPPNIGRPASWPEPRQEAS